MQDIGGMDVFQPSEDLIEEILAVLVAERLGGFDD